MGFSMVFLGTCDYYRTVHVHSSVPSAIMGFKGISMGFYGDLYGGCVGF